LLQIERSGALVTPEIFLAWRDSFEQEMRDRQEMLGIASSEVEKRPTGKEFLIFRRCKSINQSLISSLNYITGRQLFKQNANLFVDAEEDEEGEPESEETAESPSITV
jgi:hypothetical protein